MNEKFLEFRKTYPTFIYDSYDIEEINDNIILTFHFEIPELSKFNPRVEIPKKGTYVDINNPFFKNLVFHIGMIDFVSYFKCTFSPNGIIKAGYLLLCQM